MSKRKTKATYHSGRTTKAGKNYNANHNTKKKTRDGQNHIDHERTRNNLLHRIENNKLISCQSYDSVAFEKKRYKELFEDILETRNERYRKQRHSERCRDIESLYRDPKKCPFEMILQIGKANDDMTFEEKAELSKRVNIDFVNATEEEKAWFHKSSVKEERKRAKRNAKIERDNKVRELHAEGVSNVAISKEMKISRPTIYKILELK